MRFTAKQTQKNTQAERGHGKEKMKTLFIYNSNKDVEILRNKAKVKMCKSLWGKTSTL